MSVGAFQPAEIGMVHLHRPDIACWNVFAWWMPQPIVGDNCIGPATPRAHNIHRFGRSGPKRSWGKASRSIHREAWV